MSVENELRAGTRYIVINYLYDLWLKPTYDSYNPLTVCEQPALQHFTFAVKSLRASDSEVTSG
jgi:hypothetical protein